MKEKEENNKMVELMKKIEVIESEKNNLMKNVSLLNEKIQMFSENQSKVKLNNIEF